MQLAKETNTPLHLWKENTIILSADGDILDAEQANLTLKRVWKILEDAIEHSKVNHEILSPQLSLFDEFVAVTTRQLESREITSYERDLVLEMAQMWGAYVGDSVDRQSFKFFFLEDCIGGGE